MPCVASARTRSISDAITPFVMHTPPLCFVLLCWALGIALGDADVARPHLWALVSTGAAGLLVCARRRRQATLLAACLCLTGTSAWRTAHLGTAAHRAAQAVSTAAWAKTNGAASARVASTGAKAPAARVRLALVGPVRRVTEPGAPTRLQVRARLLALADANTRVWRPLAGQVRLHLWPGEPVATGDVIEVPLRLWPPPVAHNLGDASASTWARRTGLSGRAEVCGAHMVQASGAGAPGRLDRTRQRAAERLRAALPAEAHPLAQAMALGDASSLAPCVRQTWADAGMAHLLSISGLHVGLIMGLILWAGQTLLGLYPASREHPRASLVPMTCALCAGALFGLWTGEAYATLRALLMAQLAALGRALGRPQSGLQALGWAGCCVLGCCPQAVFDVGFALSFSIVLGLVLWPQPHARPGLHAQRAKAASWGGRMVGRMGQSLAITLWAQLAGAPVCAATFGRLACTSIIVNVVAVPVAMLGLVSSLLCLAGGRLGVLGAVAARCSFAKLMQLAEYAARLPGASLWAPGHSRLFLCSLAALMAAVTLWRRAQTHKGHRYAARLSCVCAAGVVAVWGWQACFATASQRLVVDHLYVGQGDATLVTYPGGLTMLVDGGGVTGPQRQSADPGRRYVAQALDRRGIRRIDVMVLTHPHPDHLGGLLYIAERYVVGTLWLNGDGLHYAAVRRLAALVQAQGGRIGPPPARLHVQGVDVESHMPLAGVWASANDHAIVLRLTYKARSMVLAADIEGRAEAALAPLMAACDILKIGHHGSRTATSEAFVRALDPRWAVISCGEANTFGFPHPETLARLGRHDVAVWRLDTLGALHLETDGAHWWGRDTRGPGLDMALSELMRTARQRERGRHHGAQHQEAAPSDGVCDVLCGRPRHKGSPADGHGARHTAEQGVRPRDVVYALGPGTFAECDGVAVQLGCDGRKVTKPTQAQKAGRKAKVTLSVDAGGACQAKGACRQDSHG